MKKRVPLTRVFNTKVKTYPDGKELVTLSNKDIFHPPYDTYDPTDLVEVDTPENLQINYVTGEVTKPELKDGESREVLNSERAAKRASERVHDIVLCNRDLWRYMLTITFDDRLQDAADVPGVLRKLSTWLRNQSYRNGLEYLLVPEYHKKDRRVHAHALINDAFTVVDSGSRMIAGRKKPMSLQMIRRLGIEDQIEHTVYNVPAWRYGFSTAVPTYGDGNALVAYVAKYITKDSEKIFGKYYWSSRDLIREPQITLEHREFDSIEGAAYKIPGTGTLLKYESSHKFTYYNGTKERK